MPFSEPLYAAMCTLKHERIQSQQKASYSSWCVTCSYVEGPMQPVYRVVFFQKDLWEGYEGTDEDNLEIEVNTVYLFSACMIFRFECDSYIRAGKVLRVVSNQTTCSTTCVSPRLFL